MTTPAIALDESASSSQRLREWTPDGVLFRDQVSFSQSMNLREIRPESGTSPVRLDLTRAPRAWNHVRVSKSAPVGFIDWDVSGWRARSEGSFTHDNVELYPLDTATAIPPAMRDRALLKTLLKLKDGKINLSVMAAEARKTAGMLGKFATDMSKVLDTDNNKKWFKNVGRLTNWRNVPSRYLEWCYGVTPLLQDLDGSMQKIAEAQNLHRPLRLKVVGVVSEEELDFLYSYCWPSILTLAPKLSWMCRRTKLVRYSLCYDVPSWALQDVSNLGLSNPLVTLYELMPYSFVLDWVIPVGDWLNALDAGAFLEFKEGSRTEMVRLDRSRVLFDQELNPGVTLNGMRTANQRAGGFSIDRYTVDSKPIFPGIPRLRKPFQLDKLAKGIALLTQVFKK